MEKLLTGQLCIWHTQVQGLLHTQKTGSFNGACLATLTIRVAVSFACNVSHFVQITLQ